MVRYFKKNSEAINKKIRDHRKKLKLDGRCVSCGLKLKQEMDGNKSKCLNCRQRHNPYNLEAI